ncbi:ribonuclease E/G, partial [Streptomyces hygroscopicus]
MLEPIEPTEPVQPLGPSVPRATAPGDPIESTPSDTLPPRRRRAASRPAGPPAGAVSDAEVTTPSVPAIPADQIGSAGAPEAASEPVATGAAAVAGASGSASGADTEPAAPPARPRRRATRKAAAPAGSPEAAETVVPAEAVRGAEETESAAEPPLAELAPE